MVKKIWNKRTGQIEIKMIFLASSAEHLKLKGDFSLQSK
jgi:hypothetical protein